MMSKKFMTIYENLRVLGLDPGTATTGWAVIEEKGGKMLPVAFGHIATSKNLNESARIAKINRKLEKILKLHKPEEAAVEKLFFFKNKKTVIQISQSRGSLLLTLEKNKVKIASYTPLQVKQALTGYGRAEKRQMQLMAKNILNLKTIPSPDDVADAIAVAICHINSRKNNQFK